MVQSLFTALFNLHSGFRRLLANISAGGAQTTQMRSQPPPLQVTQALGPSLFVFFCQFLSSLPWPFPSQWVRFFCSSSEGQNSSSWSLEVIHGELGNYSHSSQAGTSVHMYHPAVAPTYPWGFDCPLHGTWTSHAYFLQWTKISFILIIFSKSGRGMLIFNSSVHQVNQKAGKLQVNILQAQDTEG